MRTHWTTKDGRRLPVCEMSDEHLVSALRMGLRAESKRLREAANDELQHSFCSWSNGAEDVACAEFDQQLRQAFSVQALKRRLAATTRYAPLVAEVERRGLRLVRGKPSKTH